MSAYPVTMTHPETEATYVAETRLEMLDALRNGWILTAQERAEMVAKTTGRKRATARPVVKVDASADA